MSAITPAQSLSNPWSLSIRAASSAMSESPAWKSRDSKIAWSMIPALAPRGKRKMSLTPCPSPSCTSAGDAYRKSLSAAPAACGAPRTMDEKLDMPHDLSMKPENARQEIRDASMPRLTCLEGISRGRSFTVMQPLCSRHRRSSRFLTVSPSGFGSVRASPSACLSNRYASAEVSA